MARYRAVGEVEALADVLVRQPVGHELGDLRLLRGELIPGLRRATVAALACGSELAARLFGPS